jgi:hypothetical protein
MDTKYLYAAITKAEKQADGTMLVSGPVSTTGLDRDQQRCNGTWLDAAVPQWFGEGGNIREQHSHIAAGKALEYWKAEGGQHMIQARVVDPGSVAKVEHQVLTGFSIGIKNARVVKSATAPGGEIVDGKIIEVSLVDRPANPECLLVLAKSDEAGQIAPVEEQTLVERGPEDQQPETDAAPVVVTEPEPEPVLAAPHANPLAGVDVPPVAAKAEAPAGTPAPAEPPVPPVAAKVADDVSAAAQAVRVAAQGILDVVSGWAHPVDKADSENITGAQQAIAAIARLIQNEAEGLASGDLGEAGDIGCLLDAVAALRWFISREQDEDVEDAVAEVLGLSDETGESTDENGSQSGILSDEGLTTKIESIVAKALTKAEEVHKAEVQSLRDELAKVTAQPTAGGPVRIRVGADRAKADEVDRRTLLEQAESYTAKADAADDQSVANGYRAIARELREKATR